MSNAKPVSEYMTSSPHTVGQTQPLEVARKLMAEHGIHHLPVLHGGALVGMVTLRDLDLVGGSSSEEIAVEEAMTTDIYVVTPDTSLAEVADTMVKRKISSAIIADANQHVKGVFTTVDALRALREYLS